MAERTDMVMMAKIAEDAERYEDMANNMKSVVKQGGPLSDDERNLLSVAFKNVVSYAHKNQVGSLLNCYNHQMPSFPMHYLIVLSIK